MNRHVVFRVVLWMVLVGTVIGLGVLAFNAGMTQGLALGVQSPTGDAVQPPLPVYLVPYGQPWIGGGGLGCFGILMVLFLLFLIFGAARALIWRDGGGHGMHHGPWGARRKAEQGNGSKPFLRFRRMAPAAIRRRRKTAKG
jgi:hypothetical protein